MIRAIAHTCVAKCVCFALQFDLVNKKRVRIIISQSQQLQSVHGTGCDGHRLGQAAQPRGLTQRFVFPGAGLTYLHLDKTPAPSCPFKLRQADAHPLHCLPLVVQGGAGGDGSDNTARVSVTVSSGASTRQ